MLYLLVSAMLSTSPAQAARLIPDAISGQACFSQELPETIDFVKPAGLQDKVNFWKNIFSHYSSNQFVIHDRQYPQLIYKVLEISPLPDEDKQTYKERENEYLKQSIESISQNIFAFTQSFDLDACSDEILRSNLENIYQETPKLLEDAHLRVRAQRGMADRFDKGIKRCIPLKEEIEYILVQNQLPQNLFWLVFVETMCNPTAYSHAGAAGLWQLMPATARELKLTVNRKKDDRLHIHKATHAISKMFHKMYKYLGAWPLAVTGYNHGPYGIKRLTRKHNTNDLVTLIHKTKKTTFGFASQNFYAELLAVIELGQQEQSKMCP